MGKAEDAIRRRQQAEVKRQAAERRASEQRATTLRSRVIPAIQAALARLEANDYPGATLYTEKSFFGLVTTERAYWSVPIGTGTIRSDPIEIHAMLFADGSLYSMHTLGRFGPAGKINPQELGEEALKLLLPYLEQLGR